MSDQYNVYKHEQPTSNYQGGGYGYYDQNQPQGQYPQENGYDQQYYQQQQQQSQQLNQNYQYQQQQPNQPIQSQNMQESQAPIDNQQSVFRNNNETAKTMNTELRRRYPVDFNNKKSEWIGVEKHLSEVNEEIRKNEIEIHRLRQKELLTELDRKMMMQLQQKQAELNYKKRENEEILRRMAAYQEEMAKNRLDKKIMQQNMAEFYSKQKDEQSRRDQEYRLQKNDWENKLLDYNQQRITEEQRRNRDHKDFLKNAFQQDFERAQAKKMAEKQNQLQTKLEYNDLIQMNAERELTKEENYRNFYRMAAENQQKLHENHFNYVFMPLAKKQKELEDMISKNVTEAERRRLQDEIDRIQRQKNSLLETKEKNQYLMGEKQYKNELEKTLKDQQVKGRLEDLQNYNQYQEFKKKEKQDERKKYKEFLDQQQKEKQDIQLNENRMTRNEKGLNRLDLQAYKMYDNGLYTMLPGWSPQIGQLPPRQNREVLQEQIMDKIRKSNNTEGEGALPNGDLVGQSPISQSPNVAAGRTLAKAAQNSLVMQSHPNLGQFQKIGEPVRRFENPLNFGQAYQDLSGNSSTRSSALQYGHNPIINPMPFNNQNPYIAKEFNKAVVTRQIYKQPGSSLSYDNVNSSALGRYPDPK